MLKDLKNSTKKILIAHSSNDLYGSSKVLLTTIQILINAGYDIHLFLPNNGPISKKDIIKKTKIKIINLGIFRKKYFNLFGLINRLFYIIKSTLYISRYLNKNNIDLIYINTSTVISPAIAGKFNKKPVIYHIHEIPNSSIVYSKFLSSFLNYFSSKIIVVSIAVKNFWIRNNLNKKKISLIYNGFKFKINKKEDRISNKIVFTKIGRIIPYKGHLFLIDLFEKITKTRPNIELRIVGDSLNSYDSYLKFLKKIIEKKRLNNKVKFLGFVDDVSLILKSSNFLIHSNIEEDPLPTVIFEAICNNTPVIASNKGGAKEILNSGNNGLLIDVENIKKSKKLIINYIDNKEKQRIHKKNAIQFLKMNFNYNTFKTKILSVINESIKNIDK